MHRCDGGGRRWMHTGGRQPDRQWCCGPHGRLRQGALTWSWQPSRLRSLADLWLESSDQQRLTAGIEGGTMPYATGRIYNDADAHVMEPVEWLVGYADAKTRELLRPLDFSRTGKMAEHATTGKFPASHWNEVDIEKNLMFIKGWEALGAFDPD